MKETADHKKQAMVALEEKMEKIVASGGIQLPPERQLAQELQVSRETVRSLLHELEHKGKVFRRHGSGTFINKHGNKAGLLYPCQLFRDVIGAYGYQYDIKTVSSEITFAGEEEASALNVPVGRRICRLTRVFYADTEPCIYSTYYFPLKKVKKQDMPTLTSNLSSIYDILNRLAELQNSALLWDDTELYATQASAAWGLGGVFDMTDGDIPLLVQKCIYYSSQNIPLLYSVSYTNTQLIHFHLVRSKQP